MEVFKVQLTKRAEKELLKLPGYIVLKLVAWIEEVGSIGLSEVKKFPGYHDEPLKGNRQGQRSIRLSKHYRAIYTIEESKKLRIIKILEVNKHEY
jgi:proteic killer suppression protein